VIHFEKDFVPDKVEEPEEVISINVSDSEKDEENDNGEPKIVEIVESGRAKRRMMSQEGRKRRQILERK